MSPETEALRPSLIAHEYWDTPRHDLVASAAEHLLKPATLKAVQSLLRAVGATSLDEVAAWADTMKRHRPDPAHDDPETIAFLNDPRNRGNDTWHYVDLPAGATEYSRTKYPTFTRADDVVQTIGMCVAVLQGNSTRFSQPNALRLLVHLVGDVHQPLHVGCSYLRQQGQQTVLVQDPAAAAGLKSDRGGNLLILPIGASGVKLHPYWDSALHGAASIPALAGMPGANAPTAAPSDSDRRKAVAKLLKEIEAHPVESMPTLAAGVAASPTTWAEGWAKDSLAGARKAYQGLSIHGPDAHEPTAFDVDWKGQAAYDRRCQPVAARQLQLAAQRLATLLNTIVH